MSKIIWTKQNPTAAEAKVLGIVNRVFDEVEPLSASQQQSIIDQLKDESLVSMTNVREAAKRVGVAAADKQLKVLRDDILMQRMGEQNKRNIAARNAPKNFLEK